MSRKHKINSLTIVLVTENFPKRVWQKQPDSEHRNTDASNTQLKNAVSTKLITTLDLAQQCTSSPASTDE